MTKKIFISQMSRRMHTSLKMMIENPPKGYIFCENKGPRKILLPLFESKTIKIIYRKFLKPLIGKFNFYSRIYSSKASDNYDLVFSSGQVLDTKNPWVIEILDHPACMAGYDYNLFLARKKDIEKKLLSESCKAIIVVNESSMDIMKKLFPEKVMKKTFLVRAGITPKKIKRQYKKSKINILFMGSIANPEDFFIKGGLEALEAYKISLPFMKNTSMTVRCKVPRLIKRKYQNISQIKFLDSPLPQKKWEKLLRNIDICLNPGHVYPLMTILECLSYGIPIIMLNSWGVKDYLTSGKNSILIEPSKNISGYSSPDYPLNIRREGFMGEIKKIDSRVINDLSSALRQLVKNDKLRYSLGKCGVSCSKSKFSLSSRNKKLKTIFDMATRG